MQSTGAMHFTEHVQLYAVLVEMEEQAETGKVVPSECLESSETPLNTSTASESQRKASFWWHVNKNGFPIVEETWSKMWQHIADVHPDAAKIAESIRGQSLKRVPIPACPAINPTQSVYRNLVLVQMYMNELQYNHTGTQFFDVKKYRPLSR